jgi:hypothetical protein
MPLLKRLEVWILLALAAGTAAFVLLQDKSDDKALISDAHAAPPQTQTALLGCTLERDYGNARLDLEVRMTNRHDQKLLLIKPAVRLLDGKNEDIPPFILPVERPPELAPHTEATAKLRFWLEQAQLNGALTLELDGERLVVKTAKPLDLSKLKNAQPKKFAAGQDWNP